MSLIQSTLPGLFNGVGQQAPSLRLPNQAELQENALGLLADGLIKRPPTVLVKDLGAHIGIQKKDTFVHLITQSSSDTNYIVTITKDNQSEPLKIFTLDGTKCDLTYTNRLGPEDILRNIEKPHEDFKCVSVADHTFILNKQRVVAPDYTSDRPTDEYPNSGVIFIKRGLPNTDYTVEITTESGQRDIFKHTTEEASVEAPEPMVNTEKIAKELYQQMQDEYGGAGRVSVFLEGSCIFINGPKGLGITTIDSYGNQAMESTKGKVQRFTDLPPVALKGTRVTIMGAEGSTRGQYYVKYVPIDEGKGYWEETFKEIDEETGYLLDNGLNPFTMPYKLVRTGETSFELSTVTWDSRLVGDEESAPLPSFVHNKITDMFFFKNRLGFLSGDNVILSEAGEYYNFFPNTVTDILDGDPIDVSVLSRSTVNLQHAVPLTNSLLLSSETQQFLLSGAGILSPTTVTVDHNSYNPVSTICDPVSSGMSVYFVSPKGEHSSLREYYIQPDVTSNDAEDVTSHVPEYLPKEIKSITLSVPNNTLFVLPYEETGGTLYTYTYYWEGDQKVQSSWGKWVFPYRDIIGTFLINNNLYFLMIDKTTGHLLIEQMDLTYHLKDSTGFRVHLDMLVESVGSYDSVTDVTSWKLPYSIIKGKQLQILDASTGLEFNRPIMDDTYIRVQGNYDGTKCYIGVPYVFRYKFSRWYLRDDSGVAITQGNLQIRNISLSFEDTGYFKVKVTNGKREHTTEFTAVPLGAGLSPLGKLKTSTGDKRFYVGGNTEHVSIEIINDSYMPCNFQLASYEGFYTTRSRRF